MTAIMPERSVVDEIRAIREYMRDNRQYSNDNRVNYGELDECVESLIRVIDKINEENIRSQPTILEQAIMDFINSCAEGRASLEAIVNACRSRDDSFLTSHFVVVTIDRLRAENKLELLWFSGDEAYTYKVSGS